MKIRANGGDKNIILNTVETFKTDLGWQESFSLYEKDVLKSIINPVENYETTRFIHKPYTSADGITQSDIWFYFYFVDMAGSYDRGLDYSLVGFEPKDNARGVMSITESFFRLEFYKTPNGEAPDRVNRKLVFAKNLPVPLGEKQFYVPLNDDLFCPVFTGNNYRNTENMYLFWFLDDSAFKGTAIAGDTFYVTAKFFNAADGGVYDFTNKPLNSNSVVTESQDMYFKVIINRDGHTYEVRSMGSGTSRVGVSGEPIKFYERRD
jgi:hypothetical protein